MTHIDFDTLTEPVVTIASMHDGSVVFLHRQDASINFTRPWVDYRNGFGSPDTNYWIGLDHLHTLTSSRAYGLIIDMTAWDGKTFWAGYFKFSVGPESGNYTLNVTDYDWDSTLPDEMWYNNGMMFTSYDRDNDKWSGGNCARDRKGGWWYDHCSHVNPTGLYLCGCVCDVTGIVWWLTPGYCWFYSFKRVTFTLIPQ